MFDVLTDYIGKKKNQIDWRKKNRHNSTFLCCNTKTDITRITVGKATYGGINALIFSKEGRLVIGNYCSIAGNVTFLVGTEHNLQRISTYPFKVKLMESEEFEAESKGDIVIDDDVWIGHGAIILSGVHIGQGAVIAAGAVVSKDVPPYAIVGGVPAKVIKYRFEDDLIKELLKIDYSKLDKKKIEDNIENMYKFLEKKEQLEWLEESYETGINDSNSNV